MQNHFAGRKLALIFALPIFFPFQSLASSNLIQQPDLRAASLDSSCSKLLKGSEAGEFSADFLGGLCLGVILGVEDNANYDKKICVPPATTINERITAVSDYIATQPKRMDEAYASLAFDALQGRWPCKTGK